MPKTILNIYKGRGGFRWRALDKRNGKILANGGQGYSRIIDLIRSYIRIFGPLNKRSDVVILDTHDAPRRR